jgi:hypothetical protein
MLPLFSITGPHRERLQLLDSLTSVFTAQGKVIARLEVTGNEDHQVTISGADWVMELHNFPCPLSITDIIKIPAYLPFTIDLILANNLDLTQIPQIAVLTEDQKDVDYLSHKPFAVVSDFTKEELAQENHYPFAEVEALADFMWQKSGSYGILPDFSLWVNGQRIGCKGFVRDIFIKAITGMVSTLKNVDIIEDVFIRFTNRGEPTKNTNEFS